MKDKKRKGLRFRPSAPIKRTAYTAASSRYSEDGLPEIPRNTVDYLEAGASKGQRNISLLSACHQFRDSGRFADSWVDLLRNRARQDGLSEIEIAATIASGMKPAEARQPCGPVYRDPDAPIAVTKSGKLDYPPELQTAQGFVDWLQSVFRPGEYVVIGAPNPIDGQLGAGVSLDRDALITRIKSNMLTDKKYGGDIRSLWSTKDGLYVRINPMVQGGSTDSHCMELRHVLVDFDNPAVSKEDQYQALVDSNLPCSCVIDTAGKGLHAWVLVDAADKTAYKEAFQRIHDVLADAGMDNQCSNPSRYSRCPGGARGEMQQRLVSLRLGAPSWSEWAESKDPELTTYLDNGRSPADLSEAEIVDYQTLLGDRFLCRGGAMMMTGTTGIGKSSAAMQQDVAWGCGRETMGLRPNGPLKVLTLQTENDEGDLIEMSRGVLKGCQLSVAEKDMVRRNVLYYPAPSNGPKVIRLMHALCRRHKPDIIRLDPFQAISGIDIAGDVEAVLAFTDALSETAAEFNIGIVCNHHTTKIDPKAISERGIGAVSYVGAGGAQIANWARADVLLLPTEIHGTYQMLAGKRAVRLGWRGEQNEAKYVKYFKHAQEGIFWTELTSDEREHLEASKVAENGRQGSQRAIKISVVTSDLQRKGKSELMAWLRARSKIVDGERVLPSEQDTLATAKKIEGCSTAPATLARYRKLVREESLQTD